jgi:hypothetical protein
MDMCGKQGNLSSRGNQQETLLASYKLNTPCFFSLGAKLKLIDFLSL